MDPALLMEWQLRTARPGAQGLCPRSCCGGDREGFCTRFMFKWLQWSGSSGMQSAFFYRDFRKQHYHVISHMLPEPEILALLGADLLVKQI